MYMFRIKRYTCLPICTMFDIEIEEIYYVLSHAGLLHAKTTAPVSATNVHVALAGLLHAKTRLGSMKRPCMWHLHVCCTGMQ